jgi:hypothetical protein
MPDATITSTASTFGTISGTFAADQSTITGTISGVVDGTLTGSVGVPGPQGATGATGATGPQGPQGDPGQGVPVGGTTGQVLKKASSTNYDTVWGTDLASAAWGTITGTLSSQTDLQTALDLKAPLASPAFTGNPTAPTAALADNDTSLATTAFVQQELASGVAVAKNLEVYVRNQTGATLSAGTIVYINGATGNRPTVTKAQANNDANSAQTFGFVKTSIADNGFGYVIVRGECENLDTSALTEGAQLYLSPTTAGTWTTTKPYAPDHLVYVGIVMRAHPTQGVILVAIQNGYELNEIHDVKITSVSNGQVLKYDSTQGLWVNGTDSSGVAWGSITGTLSAQTDLQSALDAKLSTATAASTYAPLASPSLTGTPLSTTAAVDTNTTQIATTAYVVGQGYLKSATASSTYAPLASPALTGTPTSTTAAVNTNTTQIATTAFVLGQSAANSDAILGTSSTKFLNASVLGGILTHPELRPLNYFTNTTVSGSGAVTTGAAGYGSREMYLGSLATGRAAWQYGIPGANANVMSRSDWRVLNFSKKIWMSGKAMCGSSTGFGSDYKGDTNTYTRITLGGYNNAGTGDMTMKGIGWKKQGGFSPYFTLTVHNGTALTDVATTVQQSDNKSIDWVIYSDGTGNVTLYIDGAQAATTSAGPTGTTSNYANAYREQVEATATPTVRQILESTGGWLYIEG